MSEMTTSDHSVDATMVRLARKGALEEAATIADKEGDRLMKLAEKHHRVQEYDQYEELECRATLASHIAHRIRTRAKKHKG